MAVNAIGAGALSNNLQRLEDIKQSQQAQVLQPSTKPGEQANIDRVSISYLSKRSASATVPEGKPQAWRMFTEDIEQALGRLESTLRNARLESPVGSMRNGLSDEIVNKPEEGISGKNQRAFTEQAQQAQSQKEQARAEQSISSPSHGTLSAIVERVAQEQQSRNAQVTSQALH